MSDDRRCPTCGLKNPGPEHVAYQPLLCSERHKAIRAVNPELQVAIAHVRRFIGHDYSAVLRDFERIVAALSPAEPVQGDCPGCGAPAGYPPAGPCENHGTKRAVAALSPAEPVGPKAIPKSELRRQAFTGGTCPVCLQDMPGRGESQ